MHKRLDTIKAILSKSKSGVQADETRSRSQDYASQHFPWTIFELNAAIIETDDVMVNHNICMLDAVTVAEPQKFDPYITVPDRYFEIFMTPCYERHHSLRNLLILRNMSTMRLRFSTYHDCWHPNYKGRDDTWERYNWPQRFEGQDLENMLDNLHDNPKWLECFDNYLVDVASGTDTCNCDDTS